MEIKMLNGWIWSYNPSPLVLALLGVILFIFLSYYYKLEQFRGIKVKSEISVIIFLIIFLGKTYI